MSTVPTNPTAANVNIGLDIVLTCTARGAPEPTFAWFRGVTELTASDPRVTITPGPTSGAAPNFVTVESTLTITGSLGTDAGAYSCVTSNTIFSEPRSDTVEFTLMINCEFSLLCVMCVCVHVCKHFISAVQRYYAWWYVSWYSHDWLAHLQYLQYTLWSTAILTLGSVLCLDLPKSVLCGCYTI